MSRIFPCEMCNRLDYGAKNNRGCRYIVVVFEYFTEFEMGVPLKTKTAQTITSAFYEFIHKSTRKPRPIETDDGKNFEKQFLQSCFTIVIN